VQIVEHDDQRHFSGQAPHQGAQGIKHATLLLLRGQFGWLRQVLVQRTPFRHQPREFDRDVTQQSTQHLRGEQAIEFFQDFNGGCERGSPLLGGVSCERQHTERVPDCLRLFGQARLAYTRLTADEGQTTTASNCAFQQRPKPGALSFPPHVGFAIRQCNLGQGKRRFRRFAIVRALEPFRADIE
jgi:hypothetical protein